MGDQVIERYISEEGRYPESVGIVLWSGANMRSHGQCVAEFLYLLGVRPQWQHGSQRVIGLEVIPLMELKRPRIDVTARISGLFRDTMPSVMNLLDKAVLLVGELEEDEEQNYVRKHLLADSLELEAEGLTKEDAWRQAAFRIFGDEQGVYGAGVAALLEAKIGKVLMILPRCMFVGARMLMAARSRVSFYRSSSVKEWEAWT